MCVCVCVCVCVRVCVCVCVCVNVLKFSMTNLWWIMDLAFLRFIKNSFRIELSLHDFRIWFSSNEFVKDRNV